MFCDKCGTKLDDNARFCSGCGKPVSFDATPAGNSFLNSDSGTTYSEDPISADTNAFSSDSGTTYSEDPLSADTNAFSSDSGTTYSEDPVSDSVPGSFGSEPTVFIPSDELSDEQKNERPTVLLTKETAPETSSTAEPAFFGDSPTVVLEEDTPAAESAPEPAFFGDSPTVMLEDDAASGSSIDTENTVLIDTSGIYDNSGNQPTVNIPNGDEDVINFNEPLASDDTPTMPLQSFAPQEQPVPPQQPMFAPNNAPNVQPPQYGGAPMPDPLAMQQQQQPVPPAPQRTKVGGGKIFGASIITFLAIVILIFIGTALGVKLGMNGSMLEKRINKLDENTILSAKYQGEEISKDIYNSLGFRSLTQGHADEASFKKYLTNTNMLEFIGENVRNYADYIFEGKGGDPSLTAAMIRDDFFDNDDNNEAAEEAFDYPLGEKNLKELKKRLNENDIDTTLSIAEWNSKTGFDLKNMNYAVSYVTIGIAGAVVLLFMILIAVIVDRRGRFVAGFFGSMFTISGLITFLMGLAVIAGAAVVFTLTGNIIFYFISNVLLPFGIVVLAIGVIELFIGRIFNKVKRSKKRKEKAARTSAQQV